MASNKTISEVVIDENGAAILKQLQDTTAKIEQEETTILQEINTLANEFKGLTIAQSGVVQSTQAKGDNALLKEVGQLVYITEMQVAELNKTVETNLLPVTLTILSGIGKMKSDGGGSNFLDHITKELGNAGDVIDLYKNLKSVTSESGSEEAGDGLELVGNVIEGGELGMKLGGPYGAAGVVAIELLSHWLGGGTYADPRKDEQGNTLIGDEDVKHHVNRDVRDQTGEGYSIYQQNSPFSKRQVVNTGEEMSPLYDPKLVDPFLHINLNNENALDSKVFEADLKAWLTTHPKQQTDELKKDYTPKQVYDLQQSLKKDLGYNSLEEAFSDERNNVVSYYLDSLQRREMSKDEQERIKKENDLKHKEQFEDTQKEESIYPTIPDGLSNKFNNINPFALQSSLPGQAVSASAAIGKGQTEDLPGQSSGTSAGFSLGNSNSNAPVAPVTNNTINISSGSPASSASGIASLDDEGDNLPSASHINPSLSAGGNQSGGKAVINNISHQPNYTINNHSSATANNMHDQIVAVLTSAVADARIGTDIH